jgi:peroxiredoxin
VESQLKTRGIQPLPALIAGLLLGGAIGLVVFFGIPARPVEIAPPQPIAPSIPGRFEKGSLAPDFQLRSTANETISLSSLKGDVVLLNFWATWCAPCRIEMPLLQQAYERHQEAGLVVLGVDFDEPVEQVSAFGAELGLSFPLLLDPGGEIQGLYRIRGYPTTVLVDRSGNIATYHIGILSEGQLEQYLSEIGIDS